MGLGIWLKGDLAKILRAANEANLSAMLTGDDGSAIGGSGEAGRELPRAYRRGVVAALATPAQALGPPVTEMDRDRALAAPEGRLGCRHRPLALPIVWVGGHQCGK